METGLSNIYINEMNKVYNGFNKIEIPFWQDFIDNHWIKNGDMYSNGAVAQKYKLLTDPIYARRNNLITALNYDYHKQIVKFIELCCLLRKK